MGRPAPDILGKTFGRLTVVDKAVDSNSRTVWICKCSCGTEKQIVRGDHLIKGETQSCGCLWKEAIKQSNTLDPGEAAFNSLYYRYEKASAHDRELPFELSKEEFRRLVTGFCFYCGSEPERIHQPEGVTTPFIYNGIDRVDSGKPYTTENCVTCCTICNYAKRDLSIHEFQKWLNRITAFSRNRELKSSVTPILLVLNECYWVLNVLKSLDGKFNRIIVFDAGSNDGTKEAIRNFIGIASSEYLYEELPRVEPKAQLAYRNAPIAEVQTDYYLLVDGDEIWTEESLNQLAIQFPEFVRSRKLYGLVGRVEVCHSLKEAYTEKDWVPHHRLYHKTCTWAGTHPGERARIEQNKNTEYAFTEKVKVYHMHNTTRSPNEDYALARIKRKSQKTYHPGTPKPFDILKEIPILKRPWVVTDPITGKEFIQPELLTVLEEAGLR